MGLYAEARGGLGGVDMGEKAKCGLILGPFACGDVRNNVAALGYVGVLSAERAQLVSQKIGKIKLAGSRGNLVAVLVGRLCINLNVAEEALYDVAHRGIRHSDSLCSMC